MLSITFLKIIITFDPKAIFVYQILGGFIRQNH